MAASRRHRQNPAAGTPPAGLFVCHDARGLFEERIFYVQSLLCNSLLHALLIEIYSAYFKASGDIVLNLMSAVVVLPEKIIPATPQQPR
jgi:hypothetical protein